MRCQVGIEIIMNQRAICIQSLLDIDYALFPGAVGYLIKAERAA